jgi:REP element-mobilizing transposase RayT
MNLLPARKNIHLAPSNYVGYQRYFVTLCTFRRQVVFSDSKYCLDLLALLRTECASCHFSVLAYCLMPDHLHFLAEGLDPASDLLHLVKSFKIKTSRRCGPYKDWMLQIVSFRPGFVGLAFGGRPLPSIPALYQTQR